MINYIQRAEENEAFAKDCSNMSMKKYLLAKAKEQRERAKHER